MDVISAPTYSAISLTDFANFTKDIAQLNLGYLTISVAILVILGGVFVYFNLNPLRDKLDKQEKSVGDLKNEVKSIIGNSIDQSRKILEDFKKSQNDKLTKVLEQQHDKIISEVENKTVNLESSILEKINIIIEDKDVKLKEITLSETSNKLASVEKSLNSIINKYKDLLSEEDKKNTISIQSLKFEIKDIKRDIKELKVYRFGQEGKMGSIIYSIELLKEDIDEKRWSIPSSLENLKKTIKDVPLDSDYITQIEEQLLKIENDRKYNILIKEIRDSYTRKE